MNNKKVDLGSKLPQTNTLFQILAVLSAASSAVMTIMCIQYMEMEGASELLPIATKSISTTLFFSGFLILFFLVAFPTLIAYGIFSIRKNKESQKKPQKLFNLTNEEFQKKLQKFFNYVGKVNIVIIRLGMPVGTMEAMFHHLPNKWVIYVLLLIGVGWGVFTPYPFRDSLGNFIARIVGGLLISFMSIFILLLILKNPQPGLVTLKGWKLKGIIVGMIFVLYGLPHILYWKLVQWSGERESKTGEQGEHTFSQQLPIGLDRLAGFIVVPFVSFLLFLNFANVPPMIMRITGYGDYTLKYYSRTSSSSHGKTAHSVFVVLNTGDALYVRPFNQQKSGSITQLKLSSICILPKATSSTPKTTSSTPKVRMNK